MNINGSSQCIRAIGCMAFFSIAKTLYSAEVVVPPSRLSRTNLLVYQNRKADVMPVKSKADWLKRRAEIVAGMQAIMGPLPGAAKRCPLELKIDAEVDCGTYLRRLVTYSSEPGSRVPAYLLIPKTALAQRTRVPAILALHPTDRSEERRVGKEWRSRGAPDEFKEKVKGW